jgi:hypothetical protein
MHHSTTVRLRSLVSQEPERAPPAPRGVQHHGTHSDHPSLSPETARLPNEEAMQHSRQAHFDCVIGPVLGVIWNFIFPLTSRVSKRFLASPAAAWLIIVQPVAI